MPIVSLGASPLLAADVVVIQGTTDTVQKSVGDTDTVTVQEGAALSVDDTAIKWNTASTALQITNDGVIESTEEGGRAINAGGSVTEPRTITLINGATGTIRAESDAFRINVDITDGSKVHIVNSGLIHSTVDGQAIDFDSITSTAAGQVVIDNLEGGMIRSTDADAVRPGQGAIVHNIGTIYAGNGENTSSDGVDFQEHSGTVVNFEGGVISGARHGITTDADVMVINYGTIIGRNGSGVGSDGSGTVINYGRITGAYDGSGNGDGDGVDLDNGGLIENYGIIEALGAAGVKPGGGRSGSDGATIGGVGGTVINHEGALIYSVGGAVPIEKGTIINDGAIVGGSVGALWGGATTLTNAGTIEGGIIGVLGGNENDVVVNSGTVSGPDYAIALQGGDDRLTLLTGSVMDGEVNGGSGFDQLTLAGDGLGSFAGAVDFEHLHVASGSWMLTGASDFVEGIRIAGGASLTGSMETLIGSIDNSGTLVVDQPDDGIFTAAVTGAGQIIKSGSGTLVIGDQAFVGATRVNGGALRVTGVLPSAVTVGRGATLGGIGAIGSATIENGATLVSGGNEPFSIEGDFLQQAGSIHVVSLVGEQRGAALTVGGQAILEDGALLAPILDTQSARIGARYVVLSAAGGISGSYVLQQDSGANVQLRLNGSANQIEVAIARTASSLTKIGLTNNQLATAGALSALGETNAAYAALTLDPDDDNVRGGLSLLAGEIHASSHTVMTQNVLGIEAAVHGRLGSFAGGGTNLWLQFLGSHGRADGTAGVARVDHDTVGGLGGIDIALGTDVRAGFAGGYTRSILDVPSLRSRARVGAAHLLAYAGAERGSLRGRVVMGYAWNHVRTRRTIAVSGFSDQDIARYRGGTLHASGEIGYVLSYRSSTIEPFARATAVRVRTDAFAETGGGAALTGKTQSTSTAFSDLGARMAVPLFENVAVNAGVSWRHAYNRIHSGAVLTFTEGGRPFGITGTSLPRDAASPTLDIAWMPAANVRLSAGYAGIYGSRASETRGHLAFSVGL